MSKNPRKSAPPQTPAQRQRELARMLVRMDEILKSTGELAVKARARVAVGGLARYRRFTRRVRDFFALASAAEERLYNMPELADSPMATALDRMHARMVVLFVEGSWGFFDLYRRVPELPLGANEICGVELRGVAEISKFLDDERYDGERGQALRRQVDRIVDFMHEIMDRVPPLEDFGDLPSISPKGVKRQPIKVKPKTRLQPPPPPPPVEAETVEAEPLGYGAGYPGGYGGGTENGEPAPQWTAMRFDDASAGGPQAPSHQAPAYQAPAYQDATFVETATIDAPPPYEAAGGAWPQPEEYDDSAYMDDAPDDDDAAAPVAPSSSASSRSAPSSSASSRSAPSSSASSRSAPSSSAAPSPAAPFRPAPPPAAPAPQQPSKLVRELTMDMVEAEERRAALAQRLAAGGRNGQPGEPPAGAPQGRAAEAAPSAGSSGVGSSGVGSSGVGSSGVGSAGSGSSGSGPSSAVPRAAAPFRAPPVRPLKRT